MKPAVQGALSGLLLLSCAGGGSRSPSREMMRAYAEPQGFERFETTEGPFITNEFDYIADNPFLRTKDNPLSTFSIDVDTAGYGIARSYINNRMMPPRSSVRIEELINYFDYDYLPPDPDDERPFALHVEIGLCPWNTPRLLARIGIKAKEFPPGERPKVNLVFLLDVSGSMNEPNKLPLLKKAMKGLVERLGPGDRAAIAVYAGAAGTVLPPTSCDDKRRIYDALTKLEAGGGTAGGAGIRLAYDLAQAYFDPAAVNRVILCTDGDFNLGVSNRAELLDLIAGKARTGVYLTVLGFGMGNYRDGTLKQLAAKGNGNYGYIDTIEEAEKMLGEELEAALITVARDVKVQVEFNPRAVGAYRLIGYENRVLRQEDFRDDRVDAGDIGAGHRVTAFYELILPDDPSLADIPAPDALKYAPPAPEGGAAPFSDELFTVNARYKPPEGNDQETRLLSFPVKAPGRISGASPDFAFAAAAAAFGLLLRDSPYKGGADYGLVLSLARAGAGADPHGYRRGFIKLAEAAEALSRK